MKTRLLAPWFLCAFLLAGCGGNGGEPAVSTPVQQKSAARANLPAHFQYLPGYHAEYRFSMEGDQRKLFKKSDGSAVELAPSVQRLHFQDVSAAFDEPAAALYRLYQAAFDRVPDYSGLGYWLGVKDGGTASLDIAAAFIASDEFIKLYGTVPSNEKFLAAIYMNVLHREADSGGFAYWLKLLNAGASKAEVLQAFAESDENKKQVAPEIRDGVLYVQAAMQYAPVAKIDAPASALTRSSVRLDGSGSTANSANGRQLRYEWKLNPPLYSKALLLDNRAAKLEFYPDLPGIYTVTLDVYDGSIKGSSASVDISVRAAPVTPLPDTGIYKCATLTSEMARSLYLQGHTYLDRDHDGKPCEANDITIESPPPVVTPPSTGGGMCYVNGYYRRNGTYVRGYWRRC